MLSVLYIIILKEVVHVERFVFLACIASSGRDSSRSQFRFVAPQQFRYLCQPAVDVLHHRIVEVRPLNTCQCPGGLPLFRFGGVIGVRRAYRFAQFVKGSRP